MSHFSQQAKLYAEFRPDYPPALFEFIASLAPKRELAWDCATGNGQAAVGLTEKFSRVIATDISPEQIGQARRQANIEYRVAPAEASGIATASVDVVTVAQALHWLKHEAFYAEVRRVMVRGGALVATVYSDPTLNDPQLDRILQHYNKTVVGPYWPPERKLVDERYRTVPFPFQPLPTPAITLERQWNLREIAGYLRSWSATVRYVKANKVDPVLDFETEMAKHWSSPNVPRSLRWPFTILAGKVV